MLHKKSIRLLLPKIANKKCNQIERLNRLGLLVWWKKEEDCSDLCGYDEFAKGNIENGNV